MILFASIETVPERNLLSPVLANPVEGHVMSDWGSRSDR